MKTRRRDGINSCAFFVDGICTHKYAKDYRCNQPCNEELCKHFCDLKPIAIYFWSILCPTCDKQRTCHYHRGRNQQIRNLCDCAPQEFMNTYTKNLNKKDVWLTTEYQANAEV